MQTVITAPERNDFRHQPRAFRNVSLTTPRPAMRRQVMAIVFCCISSAHDACAPASIDMPFILTPAAEITIGRFAAAARCRSSGRCVAAIGRQAPPSSALAACHAYLAAGVEASVVSAYRDDRRRLPSSGIDYSPISCSYHYTKPICASPVAECHADAIDTGRRQQAHGVNAAGQRPARRHIRCAAYFRRRQRASFLFRHLSTKLPSGKCRHCS